MAILRITLRTWGLALLVGVLGALLGYGIELALGQAGWAIVGGSMGLCGGAIFAGSLATREPAQPAAVEPAPAPLPPSTETSEQPGAATTPTE